jgi:hypothetical protein
MDVGLKALAVNRRPAERKHIAWEVLVWPWTGTG